MNAPDTEIIARAVIRRGGDLLLARQRVEPWWFLPGGHVEPGERIEAALVRELAEELGAGATVTAFRGAVEHGYVADGVPHHELNLVFEVSLGVADPVSQEDHQEFHWLPFAQLAGVDLRPTRLRQALVASETDRTPFWRGWPG